MKALRVRNGQAFLDDVPIPDARDEALVRVIKSGICNTDLEIVRGYAGFNGTIGHEFVGIVEECESGRHLTGKRVVGEINAGCGNCELCTGGDSRHCPSRTVLGIHGRDGAHAEFLTLPARNLIEVPDSVSDESAVFAEPLAAANGICDRVQFERHTKVVVIGDGKLGLLCAMTARLKSENVVLVGKHQEKMRIAARSGVDTVMLEDADGSGRRFDVAIEASGSNSGLATALDLVRPRGTIVLKSTFEGTPIWDAARIVVDEISIVGSRCGRLAPAIELLASKSVSVEDLISDEQPLANALAALELARQKGVLKVLLSP
jgi:threonine dehydrogenase-like Zn-dependent dehydrogenase